MTTAQEIYVHGLPIGAIVGFAYALVFAKTPLRRIVLILFCALMWPPVVTFSLCGVAIAAALWSVGMLDAKTTGGETLK